MPGGRRGHKIREYRRRIDAVLERSREPRQPIPPPVSEEHADLRERIEEAHRFLLDAERSGGYDPATGIVDDPEVRRRAVLLLQLMNEEQTLLDRHGVDWLPYQPG